MRLKAVLVLGMILFPLFSICSAQEPAPGPDRAKVSYSLGYEFAENLKRGQLDIDREALFSAIRDSLDGKEPSISREEIRATLEETRKKMMAEREQRMKEAAQKNLEEGKAFLEQNKAKEGVKTLDSGLQYKVLKEGTGPSPKATDTVRVNYRGKLVNGTEFDSSYSRGQPTELRVNGVIPGWTQALQLMKVGSTWEIFVPPELGYAARQMGRIPPNSTLIFEIELVSIEKNAEAPQEGGEPQKKAEPAAPKASTGKPKPAKK